MNEDVSPEDGRPVPRNEIRDRTRGEDERQAPASTPAARRVRELHHVLPEARRRPAHKS